MRRGRTDIGVADALSGALEADIADGLMKIPADEFVIKGFLFAGGQQIRIGIGSARPPALGFATPTICGTPTPRSCLWPTRAPLMFSGSSGTAQYKLPWIAIVTGFRARAGRIWKGHCAGGCEDRTQNRI